MISSISPKSISTTTTAFPKAPLLLLDRDLSWRSSRGLRGGCSDLGHVGHAARGRWRDRGWGVRSESGSGIKVSCFNWDVIGDCSRLVHSRLGLWRPWGSGGRRVGSTIRWVRTWAAITTKSSRLSTDNRVTHGLIVGWRSTWRCRISSMSKVRLGLGLGFRLTRILALVVHDYCRTESGSAVVAFS